MISPAWQMVSRDKYTARGYLGHLLVVERGASTGLFFARIETSTAKHTDDAPHATWEAAAQAAEDMFRAIYGARFQGGRGDAPSVPTGESVDSPPFGERGVRAPERQQQTKPLTSWQRLCVCLLAGLGMWADDSYVTSESLIALNADNRARQSALRYGMTPP